MKIRDGSLMISMINLRDKFASLTTSLEIPLSKVYDVTTEPVKVDNWRTVKIFATQFPSYYAGQFYHIGRGRKFFLFSNKNSCITLRMRDFMYKEIIVEVSHNEQVAEMIRKALSPF